MNLGIPRSLERITIGIVSCLIFLRGWFWFVPAGQFRTDDAYITLRYARNFAHGYGIVWNQGEAPLEGYSNFVFLILATFAELISVDPFLFLRIMGLLGFLVALVCAYLIARRWASPTEALLAPLVISGFRGMYVWAGSGLETTFFQGLVLVSMLVLFKANENCRSASTHSLYILSGLLFALVALTRPEGPIYFLIPVVVMICCEFARMPDKRDKSSLVQLLREPNVEGMLRAVFSFSSVYTCYVLWKLVYFGDLIPHSVRCKAEYGGDPWKLIVDAWGDADLLVVVGVIALFSVKQRRSGIVVLLLSGLSMFFITYGVDPIVGYANRHFLTSFALLSVAGAAAVAAVFEYNELQRWHRWGASVAVISCVFMGQQVFGDSLSWHEKWMNHYSLRINERLKLSSWINERLSPSDTYLIGDAGLVPYLAPFRVVDAYCLNNREFTSAEINRDPERFADWVYRIKPRVLVVNSNSATSLRPRTELGVFPALVRAKQFADQYQLRAIYGFPGDDFYFWVFELSTEGEISTIP